MRRKIKNNNSKIKYILTISICFVVLLLIFLLTQENIMNGTYTVLANESDFCYLSDIPYDTRQSKPGWGTIHINETDGGANFSVKIEGALYSFEKGIWAHASSKVVYDLTNYSDYDYLTTYMGVNNTSGNRGNGVKFYIYTSTDGSNWELKTEENPPVIKSADNAIFAKIDIKGAKFLKLEANDNGSNGNDHSVYVDAKLIKETYKEPGEELVPSIDELDNKIKTEFANADLTNPEYELTLLKRELINRVGNYALKRFLGESEQNTNTYVWLTSNLDVLRLYMLGGTPEGGSYYNSLTQLSRLYDEYSNDFTNSQRIQNDWCPANMTKGDLYKKMAISLSLTHSQRVGLWMQSGATENQSDALKRYAIYKYMYENGKLNALGGNWDITKWFESLQVEEMRFIMNNAIDDEEILWLNAYVQDKLEQYHTTNYLTPHPYMAYVWPSYGNEIYYAEENKSYFNELFAVNKKDDNAGNELSGENAGKVGLFDTKFTIPGGKNNPNYTFKVTRGTPDYKLYKVWMNFRNKFGTGAVCGGISKSGSNIRTTHGIPATVIGQPGHAALLYYTKNTQGKGYWGIDNDVSGWTLSEKGERMLLGWGNATYSRGYSVVYMVLAQEVINDYENLVKCEEEVMRAKVYEGNLAKQEEIYRKALQIQPINIDAWVGLINVYNASENKTENDYYNLAEELAEKLKCFPLPMQHLTNLIKPKLTSVENIYRFTLLQTRILTEGSKLPNTSTEVLQPSVTRTEANYLLGKLDKTIATFSFDGADAGKIVLSSRFDGNGVRWDYSLDGKQTWNEVSFTAEEEHKLQLTPQQISSITADNDIYVHIVGVNYDEENLYKIDITEGAIPATLFANDFENRIVGVNLGIEWRYSEKDKWTLYSVSSPDLTGDKTIQIRQSATGTQLTSPVATYNFTKDNQPETRKYIPVSHLTIEGVSSEATAQGRHARNAIDANYNTNWHSAWNGSDTERYIIVKLDQSVYLSAVEYVPGGGGNGKILDGTIYGSMDGENWEELKNLKNLTYTNQANTNEDAIKNTKGFEIEQPKEVKYVKIVADRASNGNWFTARAFNFFQDITKNPHPTAGIAYSTTEPTNGMVVARLVNPSTKITITNNDGKDTYIFNENGEFTFEFEDEKGNTGSAVAKVNWIDKDIPSADIDYDIDDHKKLVILLDGISEDVYLLDKDNKKINFIEVENGKVKNISYLDSSNNVYKVVEVDENGVIKKITYKNTTGKVSSVGTYVTTMENGAVSGEEYFDNEGNSVTITDSEKETLRQLQQAMTNPLEYTFEESGEYEFKMLDKASNIAYKSIKADYIENDTTIIASDITYNITKLTNTDVIATIKPYIIDTEGKAVEVEMVNNNKNKQYTFTENGEFEFEYKDSSDSNNWDVKKHKAKVSWIDKTAPTAEISYSTKEPANKVVAKLVNESEQIIVTNNGTSREYTFTENGEFTFEFEDLAGNKSTAVAKVDWINKDEEPDDSEEGITSEIYKIEEDYISKITPKTTISTFKKNVETDQELTFMDKDGKPLKDSSIIKTGTKLKVGDIEYTLVVTGDINGDGEITITDLAKVKLHYIEKELLTGAELKAADMNYDGEITVTDIAQIKSILIGKK